MTRVLLIVLSAFVSTVAFAHEVRPARLTLTEISADQFFVQWKVPAYGDRVVAIHPEFDVACAADDSGADRFAGGASVRTWRLDCSAPLAGTRIGFRNQSATMIDVLVQIDFLDGRQHMGLVRPDEAVYTVPDRAGEGALFAGYFVLGVEHILLGWDHLLFVLGVVLLVTSRVRLLWALTGFTLGHSLTLALVMFDVVRLDGRPVEALIALSILFLAVECARYSRTGEQTLAIRRPWVVSTLIGLVHGLGFAGALSEYGLPAYARVLTLAAFNLGVEIGQVVFVLVLGVLVWILRRFGESLLVPLRQCAVWLVGVCGAFWLVERMMTLYN